MKETMNQTKLIFFGIYSGIIALIFSAIGFGAATILGEQTEAERIDEFEKYINLASDFKVEQGLSDINGNILLLEALLDIEKDKESLERFKMYMLENLIERRVDIEGKIKSQLSENNLLMARDMIQRIDALIKRDIHNQAQQ